MLNEVPVNGANAGPATVLLSPSVGSLDDVVVVGYGMQKRTTVTGASGMVLITTKQGKTGSPSISVNTWYGIQAPTC